MRQLALLAVLATALIGFVLLGPSGAPPIAPREQQHDTPTSQQPAAHVHATVVPSTLHAAVRERASSPLLDLFEERHREAVSQVLAEGRTVVVECLVLDPAFRLEKGTGTATLRLLCRETSEAKGVKKGDVIEAVHCPADERKALQIDTGYEHIRSGEIRAFLLQRRWLQTALRIPGAVTGAVDFDALRSACDWPTGQVSIGDAGCSVLEGRMVPVEPSDRSKRPGDKESLLTIERVYWSAVGWEPAQVHRVKTSLLLDDSALQSAVESESSASEKLPDASPPEDETVLLLVWHGWLIGNCATLWRVR